MQMRDVSAKSRLDLITLRTEAIENFHCCAAAAKRRSEARSLVLYRSTNSHCGKAAIVGGEVMFCLEMRHALRTVCSIFSINPMLSRRAEWELSRSSVYDF